MRYCANCHVHVRGDRDSCPLCHNVILTEGVEAAPSPYPDMPLQKEKTTLLQVVSFIALTSVIISILAFFVWPIKLLWPALILFAMASMWIIAWDICVHHQIERGIFFAFFATGLIAFGIDLVLGWRGWSLTYAIPILAIGTIFSEMFSVKILKLQVEDYLLEWLVAGIFGMIPYFFIQFHWVGVILPSFLSVVISVIFFVGLLIFRGLDIWAELCRRWHI